MGRRWRLDETDVKVQGQWRALERAVAQTGPRLAWLLTEARDEQAAKRFLTNDGRAAHEAAIKSSHGEHGTASAICQVNYRNNLVEQDPRGVKRLTRPMGGGKACAAAPATLVGIELMPRIKPRQLGGAERNEGRTAAALFYSLAASSLPQTGATVPSRSPEQNLRQNRYLCPLYQRDEETEIVSA